MVAAASHVLLLIDYEVIWIGKAINVHQLQILFCNC